VTPGRSVVAETEPSGAPTAAAADTLNDRGDDGANAGNTDAAAGTNVMWMNVVFCSRPTGD